MIISILPLEKTLQSVIFDSENYSPEISPQINHLPCAQRDQDAHRTKREPLDPLIGAFVRVPQLLFSCAEIIHLSDDLRHHLFHPAQFGLGRL